MISFLDFLISMIFEGFFPHAFYFLHAYADTDGLEILFNQFSKSSRTWIIGLSLKNSFSTRPRITLRKEKKAENAMAVVMEDLMEWVFRVVVGYDNRA